jgi:putative acetyltransferase
LKVLKILSWIFIVLVLLIAVLVGVSYYFSPESIATMQYGEVIGQITFSPAIVEDASSPWFALGPVSVVPSRQGEGVGSALIHEGLGRIKSMGALGCILTGDPNYYRKFGFALSPTNAPENEPEQYFQLKLLGGEQPVGKFSFHRAFYEEV